MTDRNEKFEESFKKASPVPQRTLWYRASEALTRMSHDSDLPPRPGFKEALKARISDVRQHTSMPSFSWFNGWSPKFAYGGTVALVAVIILMLVLNPFSSTIPLVYAQDNFTLTAETEDSLGVDSTTGFILESQEPLDMDFVRAYLKSDIDLTFELDKLDDFRARVTFKEKLTSGQMVRFLLPTEVTQTDGSLQSRPYAWAFQVKTSFHVLNSIPGDKTSKVPLDAGIEVNFSHENVDVKDFERAFSVEPKLTGHVEKNRRSLVFVPDKLEPATVYTVTIDGALHPAGSNENMEEDYTFRFETSRDSLNRSAWISFVDNSLTAIPTQKAEFQISFQDYYTDSTRIDQAVFTAYRFPTRENFKQSFEESFVDSWRAARSIRSYVPLETLTSIGTFKPEMLKKDYYPTYQVPFELEEGYYGIHAVWQGQESWAFIQSISVTATLIEAENSSLIWVHDTNTKSALSGADVKAKDVSATTDSSGVARVTLPEDFGLLEISSGVRTLFLPILNGQRYYGYGGHGWWGGQSSADEDYWGYMYTDRTVYSKGDTVHVWGFLKHRDGQELPSQTTLRLTLSVYSSGGYHDVEFVRHNIEISSEGIFSGEIVLPDVGRSYFGLGVYLEDQDVLSRSVQVQEYRKPVYLMELDVKEKAAIFYDDIHYRLVAKYFDGTPVAGKKVVLRAAPSGQHDLVFGDDGTILSAAWIAAQYGQYGTVSAVIDEPGFEPVTASDTVHVYPSSVHLKGEAKIENGIATVQIDSRSVVITDSDDREDDVKTPRPDTSVDIQVFETYYEKKEEGTYYDFIRKSVRKNYRHILHTDLVHTQTVVTDASGHATVQFAAPHEGSSYKVEMIAKDDHVLKRKEFQTLYAIRDDTYSFPDRAFDYSDYNYDHTLSFSTRKVTDEYGNEDVNFEPGEKVELEVRQYNKRFEMIDNGSFLFVQAQRGIQEYQINSTPQYDFTFEERDIPNVYVFGVLFTGSGYVVIDDYGWGSYGKYLGFDSSKRELHIDVQTDADAYRPGGEAEVSVRVLDAQGNPVSTSVNLSVVDEAYFALFGDSPDPLGSLYRSLSSGILGVIVSHEQKLTNQGAEGGGGGDGEVRSNFVDTGAFVNLTTGNDGIGKTKIKMPDNVTSWRLTVHAIDTKKIQAGVSTKNITTTLPFFINAAIQPTYLTEDQPEIIVTAQGTAVKQSDKVYYEISVKDTEIGFSMETTVSARAHLPLPKLPEGKQTILIKAKTGDKKDAISQVVSVVPSRLSIPVVEERDVSEINSFTGSETGLTWVTFVDGNQGKFYRDLQWMSWRYGDRADEATVRTIATELLNETFGEDEFVPEVDAGAYQAGGIRLLSHADMDPILTAKIALFGETPFNEGGLESYLLDRLYESEKGKILSQEEAAWAYAGLAALKTPVFAELKRFEQQELSQEAKLAVAIAHLFVGDSEGARALYRILMKDAKRELKYVWVERQTPEENMEANAALYVLAAGLNEVQDRDGLKDHLDRQAHGQTLTILEELLAIKQSLAFAKAGASEFSYTLWGETQTVKLEKGQTTTVAVSALALKSLKPNVIKGDVSAILSYQKPISTLPETYKKIGLVRTYTGSFKAGEVVLVTLTYAIDPALPKEYFEITDSVPSGLTPVTYRGGYESYNTCITYPETDTDQTLTFFTYKEWSSYRCAPNTIRYYARVMNTGTFKAEPASIRAMRDTSLINFSNAQTITITQ